ncbi:hypothetical protein C2G38_2203383 [Gigaspora rosea]|uniref:Uncharacterized protein n=1 Tax=Gigaspora rosea TaxID=44941 RepID=A0A397UQG5_9GLOM|nr:hypothetical protein C2G38_2203383 [Gigaspora rosea]
MDQANRKNTPISEESVIRDYASSSRVDTEIIFKPENHASSLIESNSQMRHSLKALLLPIEG